jgi:uncharacterized protein YjbI with pentapeptide repeats
MEGVGGHWEPLCYGVKRGILTPAQGGSVQGGKAMTQKRKLQVFVSSTYADLREERQAAVEAILMAGHIPAGMELFTAGDQSQMDVIRRWIDESDVFLLILGGRYGSIEPTSQKSYIHLEYEYALEKNKPSFAVVIQEGYLEEKARKSGGNIDHVMERVNYQKWKELRDLVSMTRIVKFWNDPRDIQLAIHGAMKEFSDRSDVIGWIPANEAVNTGPALEEIARLTKENTELRQKLSGLSTTATSQREEQYRSALNWDSTTRLRGFDLSHRDLSGLTLNDADLAGADLCNAVLQDSSLEFAILVRANLNNANLRGAQLHGANLYGANLAGADLDEASLTEAHLDGANLARANLAGANLHRAKLISIDLHEADLQGANLSEADLHRAVLRAARYNTATQWPSGFNYVNCGAIGPQADLQGANLNEADLRNADLRGANLNGADLRGANLNGADLHGAILAGAHLEEANLHGARYNTATQWPSGFDYQRCGAIGSP